MQNKHSKGRQLPIAMKGHTDQADHRKTLPYRVAHGTGDRPFHGFDVVQYPGHQYPRMMVMEVGQWHVLQMLKQTIAHVADDSLSRR